MGEFLRIHNNLGVWTAKEDFKRVQNVSSENALMTQEIRVQLALVLGAIQLNPYREAKRVCRTASNSTHQTRRTLRRVKLQRLAVDPRQRARISSRVRYHLIENQAGHAAEAAELGPNY